MESLILAGPHWEALTPETRAAFDLLANQSFIQSFYLAGGTGLALHLGHRYSVDMDFFSDLEDAVGVAERAQIRQVLEDKTLVIAVDQDQTLIATWHGVGISFFRLTMYPLVQPTLTINNIQVANLIEIGAMKLAAIIGRGTRKDLVDIYFILQQVAIEELFTLAAVKYSKVRSFGVSATRALAYFDDAEALPMPRMIDRTPWGKMRKFLELQAFESGRLKLQDLWE